MRTALGRPAIPEQVAVDAVQDFIKLLADPKLMQQRVAQFDAAAGQARRDVADANAAVAKARKAENDLARARAEHEKLIAAENQAIASSRAELERDMKRVVERERAAKAIAEDGAKTKAHFERLIKNISRVAGEAT